MRKLILLATLCFYSILSQAQYWEAGFMAGGMSYVGELQPSGPSIGSFQPSGGAFLRRNFSPRISAKVAGIYGGFNATDYTASGTRRLRNLETKTTLIEASASVEYSLMKFDIMDERFNAPYLTAGVAAAYYKPQARYNGKWTDLRSLGTEGQLLEGGKPYSPIAFSVPMGVGFRMALTKRFIVGVEFGYRLAFTDYLDDISGNYPDIEALTKQSQTAADLSFKMPAIVGAKLDNPVGQKRGDSYAADHYYFGGVTLSVNLGGTKKLEYNTSYRDFYNTSGN